MSSISEDVKHRIISKALLSRAVEERLLSLFAEGKLSGTIHTCIGQEFTPAIITEFLIPGDVIYASHRCHGYFLSQTSNATGLVAELMGKATGVCGGFGGSQHLHSRGFFSNGVLGGGTPIAAGNAFGLRLANTNNIAISVLGDGAIGEGVIYETFNLASKWDVPLLFVLEDNGFAQSTSKQQTLAGNIAARAQAFNLKCFHANTWQWEQLYSVADEAVCSVRERKSPAILIVDTYRLKAHSKGDDNRDRSEVESFEQRDPLNILLQASGSSLHSISCEIESQVNQAVQRAECAEWPRLEEYFDDEQGHATWTNARNTPGKVLSLINQALAQALQDPKVVIFGEDVESPYGGAFKATQNLSHEFPGRVRNTPISEAAITGFGTGLALAGFRPIVEIMFGDFTTLAFDQLVNHAAKFEQMYNRQVKPNVIVRTPMGGRRGYGPTHSQTLDRHFLGVPGLRVIAINTLVDPRVIYKQLLTNSWGPVLMIENKILYSKEMLTTCPGFQILHSNDPFPIAWLKPETPNIDVSILGYGGMSEFMVKACELLFEEHEVVAQVICPSQIYPFNVARLSSLLAATKALVVVEEGQGFAGFSAEILAQLAQADFATLKKAARVLPKASCIPASSKLEKEVLPDVQDIVNACISLLS